MLTRCLTTFRPEPNCQPETFLLTLRGESLTYQDLVLREQNLLRWFRRQFLGHTILPAAHSKELVRIGAHGRALIRTDGGAWTLTFTGDGPCSSLAIRLREQLAVQLEFPFLDDDCRVAGQP